MSEPGQQYAPTSKCTLCTTSNLVENITETLLGGRWVRVCRDKAWCIKRRRELGLLKEHEP